MYCSKCGVQNVAEVNYCRVCGNSFQKLSTNELPEAKQFDDVKPYNQERAFKKLFMGIGFLIISSMLHSSVKPVFLVLGIIMLVKGVRLLQMSKLVSCASSAQTTTTPFHQIQETSAQQVHTNPRVRQTGELVQPPSITENTTKLFDER
jgi:ABC-type bacteriocin/lantibiotic exporter with double-glycine peptidase domain